MSTRQPLTVAAVLLLLPCVVQAQDVGPDVDPGRLLLEDKEQRNVHVLSTHGPTGGMVVDLTYGMGDEPALYGLTEVGVFRYDRERRFWERTPILAPEDPTLPIVPMRVDMAHLIGERELYPPMSVELHVEAQHAYLLTEQNNVFRAPLKGGSWVAMSPPNDTVAGRVPFEAASRVSMAIGPDQTASMVLLRSDPELSRAQEQSRLWWVKSGRQRWQSTDLAGRSTLIRTSRPTGIGASWRYEGLMTSIAFGKGRYQVQRFVHLIEEMGKLSFDTLAWASLLDNSGSEIREGCWDATGMMEVTTWAGEGEPPVLIAIGARTLCVSTDGGLTFAVRDTHLDPTRPREVIGHMASATAFAHRDAQAGVRLIVGTQAVLNPAGPKTRADGGRLFMSDDAGRTWTDITPDIDAPGGFVDLESYAIDSAQGGTEVWLLTERRGVYLSTTAGMGFDQANVALSAQPIHGIATDPTAIDQILAAGPTGTFKSSTNGWSQTLLLPARSIASVPATPDDQGQVWIGSYWGQVQVRHQLTGFE
ncbi:MAG: sialidase family protein, partial [Myxococcota bacterium]